MDGVLRTGNGEIRFLWKLIVSLPLILVLIVISRLSLILVVQQVFIFQGIPSSTAFQNAQVFVAETTEGQAVAASLDLLLMFLLVLTLVTRAEKREFRFADIGLKLQRSVVPFSILGLLIGCGLFFGAVMLGLLFGTISLPVQLHLEQWPLLISFVSSIIFYVLNSFWQEMVFRGYLQSRAVEEHGRSIGIVSVAVVFVVFHGLVQTLTPTGIISGVLLFCSIGLLYEKTKSLYLVGMTHTAANFLPVLFAVSFQGLETIIIYGIVLLVLVLIVYKVEHKGPVGIE
jgi:membrane protease YdiL (CAAX protease family)